MPTRLAESTNPLVYEINTWPWLAELSSREGRSVDLGSVPDQDWDDIAALGFDAVWLMGVWQRSPAGVAIALDNPDLTASFRTALPGFVTEDVVGSPYCIRAYVVDDHLGGADGLALARAALAARGLGLLLDFVPNHVAPDHRWATERPELFVTGTEQQLQQQPNAFVRVGNHILANGRDPYFPAWPDVVQLNAFSAQLRDAVLETLLSIAGQCDGVRCDMAMLMMNDVFARTWGAAVGPAPQDDYWPTVIAGVREHEPNFLFMAEAYWDLEWSLQQQGFDYCYDKRLYDRIRDGAAEPVDGHLHADPEYQRKLARFIENHDEPRAVTAFGADRCRVAAVTALTQTGLRLIHHGQLTGAAVHLPVFLGRYPAEPADRQLRDFYARLLGAASSPTFRSGRWQLCERVGWPTDSRYRDLVAWCWTGDDRWLVVVNLTERAAAGLVKTPWAELTGRQCRLVDLTQDIEYARSGDDLVNGLFVALEPHNWHLFRVDPSPDPGGG